MGWVIFLQVIIILMLWAIGDELSKIGKLIEDMFNKKKNNTMSYRVRRGNLTDEATLLKVRWCKLHRSEYWEKCWTAWAGRAFMPVHCEGCEFFNKKFAQDKRNELFCR